MVMTLNRQSGIFEREGEMTDAEYLADLSERLMGVPIMYGTDQSDCDRLNEIATKLGEKQ